MGPNKTILPSHWRRDWLAWLFIGAVVYILAGLFNLAADVGRPFPGFLTYFNPIWPRIDVEWNTPAWWWSGAENQPRVSDLLEEVEGVSFVNVTHPLDESAVYADAWRQGKRLIRITVWRDGAFLTLETPLILFDWWHFTDLVLLPVVMFTVLWLLAFILYRAAPGDERQRAAAFLLLTLSVMVFSVRAALFEDVLTVTRPVDWVDAWLTFNNPVRAVTFPLVGILFLRVAFYFPRPLWPQGRRYFLAFVYILGAAAVAAWVGERGLIWQRGVTPLAQRLDLFWFKTSVYLVAGGVLLVLARLLWAAFAPSGSPRLKREARIMLAAFILGMPAIWIGVYRGLVGAEQLPALDVLLDGRYFLLTVPFAFAAITLRYHTFAGAERLLILALTLALSGLAANITLVSLFWQSPIHVREFSPPPQLILLILFLAVGLFWTRQSEWRGWLGRAFQWERASYNEARRFGRLLADAAYEDAEQLARQITAVLHQTLSVENAALWLRAEDGRARLAAHEGDWRPPPELSLPPDLPPTPLRLRGQTPDWARPLRPRAAVALPLAAAGRQLGLLAVGKRWDSAVFDDRDLEILDLIAQQAALFLHNVQQMARARAADRQMLQIQENTRRQIAQDLHDYVLPSLGRLPLALQTSLNWLEKEPEKARPPLEESIDRLEENVRRIRRIQQSLVIRPLQYGLAIYLEELAQRFQRDTNATVRLTLPPNLDAAVPARADRETIYAVCRQALDNAQAHAQASRVEVTLTLHDDALQFSICDDGVGVSPEQLAQATAAGHFGLKSMQTRLENAGGRFEFISAPGEGACVKGEMPLRSAQKIAKGAKNARNYQR